MIRYLSLEWIDALAAEVASSSDVAAAAAGQTIGVTQVVNGTPEGDVTYHLQVGDDGISFGAGPAWPEDVRMVQSWDTAVAVATNRLNAQEAFIKGQIALSGNQQKLIESQPLFAALDMVFNSVRARTDYS